MLGTRTRTRVRAQRNGELANAIVKTFQWNMHGIVGRWRQLAFDEAKWKLANGNVLNGLAALWWGESFTHFQHQQRQQQQQMGLFMRNAFRETDIGWSAYNVHLKHANKLIMRVRCLANSYFKWNTVWKLHSMHRERLLICSLCTMHPRTYTHDTHTSHIAYRMHPTINFRSIICLRAALLMHFMHAGMDLLQL